MVATNIYFSYTGWYFKENMLASMWPPVGLKITGVSTQGGQFCRVGTQLQRHYLLLLAGSFVTQSQDSKPCTYPIILFSIISQVLSLCLNPFVLVIPLLLQLQPWIANVNPNFLPSSYFGGGGIQKEKGSFLMTTGNLILISEKDSKVWN